MWCAMHVKDGKEVQMETFVLNLLSDRLDARCFHLTRYRRKKYGGQWQTVQEKLLPGYIFITTDKPEQLYRELKRAKASGILWSNEEYVAALKEGEADLIEKIAGGNDNFGEILLSEVELEQDGCIKVLSGPLLQVEDKIRKIDLHKRVAEIETNFMGQKKVLYLGIEFDKKM